MYRQTVLITTPQHARNPRYQYLYGEPRATMFVSLHHEKDSRHYRNSCLFTAETEDIHEKNQLRASPFFLTTSYIHIRLLRNLSSKGSIPDTSSPIENSSRKIKGRQSPTVSHAASQPAYTPRYARWIIAAPVQLPQSPAPPPAHAN